MSEIDQKSGRPADNGGLPRLSRLERQAGLALLWERLWPALLPALGIIALFLTVSWLGLWIEAPRWGRIAGTLLFGLAFLAALLPLARLPRPSRRERLARLDRDSGLAHRPASTLADSLARPVGEADATTQALWTIHRQRAQAQAARLKVAAPSPRMVDRDRYALRAAALLALLGAAFVAGSQKEVRLAAAFDWRGEGALSQGYRLDAWIDPPAYTGRAPILLSIQAADSASAALQGETKRRIEAPAGSVVVVRASGNARASVETAGALEKPEGAQPAEEAQVESQAPPASAAETDLEERWIVRGDGRLTIVRDGTMVADVEIRSIPDKPPAITETEPMTRNARGSMTLKYRIEDDYGVTGAEAAFARPIVNGKPVTGRSLAPPPRVTLSLPPAPGGLGQGETTADVSEHAWAGARVEMRLSTQDEGGNSAESAPSNVTLPQRPFVKPLARALVEQRRNLVLSPDDSKPRILAALEGLMIEPETFGTTAAIYLGLRSAHTRLAGARNDEALLGVADFLWEMALRIEDGDLSNAEKDLRAAQQALREALERGASDEEIKKLMEDLRAAMDKFLREFAEQMQRDMQNGQAPEQQPNQNQRMLTQRDLNNMMDRMEEMARSGNRADAQRMLDQLQRMMENLQSARRQPQRGGNEMARQMDNLDRMIREQQDLRDRTFRQQQQGQNGQELSQEELRQRQQALREQLEELKRRMREQGMSGEQGLDEAEQAMREAEEALGEGQEGQEGQGQQGQQGQGRGQRQAGRGTGRAVDAQGRALEGLRRGMQGMAQQMQRMPGQQGEGEPGENDMAEGDDWGNPDPNARPRRADGSSRDPLDRPRRNSNRLNDSTGLHAGPGAAERAREVLEELRRRLGDRLRPQDELDYLERLLRRY